MVVAVIGSLVTAGFTTGIGRALSGAICRAIGADCGDTDAGGEAGSPQADGRYDSTDAPPQDERGPGNQEPQGDAEDQPEPESEPASGPKKKDGRNPLEKGLDWLKDDVVDPVADTGAKFAGGVKDKVVEEYYDGPKQLFEGLVDDPFGTGKRVAAGVVDEVKRPFEEAYGACKKASGRPTAGNMNSCGWKVAGRFTPFGAVDLVVDDDVKQSVTEGNWGHAGGQFMYNGVTTVLPVLKAGKGFSLVNKIKKGNRGARKTGDLGQKATDAADKARKAARDGDLDGAKKAADEAQQHADDAAEKAAKEGACPVAGGGDRPAPYGGSGQPGFGVAGSGTGIMAADAADSQVAVLAGRSRKSQACEEAQEAQAQADEAKQETEKVATSRNKKRAAKIVERAKSGTVRKAPNYHGRLPSDLESDILANAEGVYASTGTGGRLIFQKDGNMVIVEGQGAKAGQVVTSYGKSGPRGESGAAIYGGSPTQPGKPVTKEMIEQGKIPNPKGGTLAPGVRIDL